MASKSKIKYYCEGCNREFIYNYDSNEVYFDCPKCGSPQYMLVKIDN